LRFIDDGTIENLVKNLGKHANKSCGWSQNVFKQ
jgi:hypothetical protein